MFGFAKKTPSTRNLRDGSQGAGGNLEAGSLASSASGTPRGGPGGGGGGRFNPSTFALLSAAEQGLTAELTRLLAMRAGTGGALVVQVNDRDEFGRTALHVAARHGNLDAVKLLAETHGADLNAVTLPHPEGPQQPSGAAANDGDNEGSLGRKTPLHMALEAKRFEVAHYLLAKGATARAPPVAGEPGAASASVAAASTTALHLAAANCPTEGDAATIKTFTGTPDRKKRPTRGSSRSVAFALFFALLGGADAARCSDMVGMILMLLGGANHQDALGNTALHYAVYAS